MVRLLSVVCLLGPLMLSCGRGDTKRPSSSATEVSPMPAPAMVPAPMTTAPRKRPPSDREKACAALRKAYLDRRAQDTGACKTDADCGNAPGGIDDCGRVTDKATAQAVYDIYLKIRKQCGLKRHCAPRISIPTCVGGGCVRRSSFGRLGGMAAPTLGPKKRRP